MSDDLRTLFRQSTVEPAEDSLYQSTDDKIKMVIHYHAETKHNFNRFARSRGYLDWETQPDPFRRYTGAEIVSLPFIETDETPPYDRLFDGRIEPKLVSLKTIGLLLNLFQIALFAATAFVAPTRLRPTILRYLAYSFIAAVVWMASAVAEMFYNSKAKLDVPGIGYLLLGFVGWVIGSVIFGVRAQKAKT